MIYLKNFILPSLENEEKNNSTPHAYPYGIFPFKKLELIEFGHITIFYGGNGSGKSTLVNLIAEKLNLQRDTYFNTSDFFEEYVDKKCSYNMILDKQGIEIDIPTKSKIITSEDIFDYILSVRKDNIRINKNREIYQKQYMKHSNRVMRFNSLDDYDEYRLINETRRRTMTKFVNDRVQTNIKQFSNGETAMAYFDEQFKSDTIYILDEPENSLSPMFQKELAKLIIDCTYYCNCQFIIATHSPFLLSIEDSKIYDLDVIPCRVRNWYELDNMKIYYELFNQYKDLF